jgi:hypothetical protein
MFANTQMMGLDTGFPDVCLTPSPAGPVPIPYPNIAAGPMGVPAAYNVLFMAAPAHNMSTSVPGVASGMVMGPSRHLTASFTTLVGGMPATRLTSASLQNSTNCPGARVVPSQVKVLILAP